MALEIAGCTVDVGVDRHQPALDQVGLGRAGEADGHVGLAHAEIDVAVADDQRDADVGVPLDEVRKLPHQPDRADADGRVDPQVAGRRVAAVAERRLHRGHPLGDLIGRMQQYFPLLGQHEAACVAMEQRGGEILLERTDLPADRRLAQAKPLRGTGEAAGMRDGMEDADPIPIHALRHSSCFLGRT